MQCARSLIDDHGLDAKDILILEAQDYVGGRVKQNTDFCKNTVIELGAEIIHGNNTKLTDFAHKNNEPLIEAYCWAHGDGGPFEKHVNGFYGLYYVGVDGHKRLLRYDDSEAEFIRLNQALKDVGDIDQSTIDDNMSLEDYLISQNFSKDMRLLAAAGFSNTFCAVSETMSFKQVVRNTKLWHGDPADEAEFRFKNNYSCLVNHLKKGLNILLKTPVKSIDYSKGYNESMSFQQPDSPISTATRELVYISTASTPNVTYTARSVVVTASPKVLRSDIISFVPPLSEEKLSALDTIDMHRAMKVILKFKQRPWPKQLQGMIMSTDNSILPEIWFKEAIAPSTPESSSEKIDSDKDRTLDEEGTCVATGFACAKYADKLIAMGEEEVYRAVLAQIDEVFHHLQPAHMSAEPSDEDETPEQLPKPSSVFVRGMIHDWQSVPYISGGYSCATLGWNVEKGQILADPISHGRSGTIFFAGEATNIAQPGGTAHAALETVCLTVTSLYFFCCNNFHAVRVSALPRKFLHILTSSSTTNVTRCGGLLQGAAVAGCQVIFIVMGLFCMLETYHVYY